MTSTGISAAKSEMRSPPPRASSASSSRSTMATTVGLEPLEHVRRQCTDDLSTHPRVIRRVVEDQARGVMRVERRIDPVFRRESRALIGAEVTRSR